CELPAERGPCNKLELRYRFSEESEYCQTFLYGGCEGNRNNFKTIEECVKTCVDERLPVCDQPRDTGTCAAHRVKYFYNKATKSCEEFTYTGCEGNDNRFDSMEQCEATCTFSKAFTCIEFFIDHDIETSSAITLLEYLLLPSIILDR
ncbi:hypothetical protein FSP39_023576, partial [Pinctada imbricata]